MDMKLEVVAGPVRRMPATYVSAAEQGASA